MEKRKNNWLFFLPVSVPDPSSVVTAFFSSSIPFSFVLKPLFPTIIFLIGPSSYFLCFILPALFTPPHRCYYSQPLSPHSISLSPFLPLPILQQGPFHPTLLTCYHTDSVLALSLSPVAFSICPVPGVFVAKTLGCGSDFLWHPWRCIWILKSAAFQPLPCIW